MKGYQAALLLVQHIRGRINAIKLSIELSLHLAFQYIPPCAASLCSIDWVLLTFIYLLFTFLY